MGVVFQNSAFINEEDLIIKSSNRAFNYGDGFFETIKIINCKPFNFSAHYNRCLFACSVLKLKNTETEKSLLALILELVKQNKMLNGSVKIHISRSEGGKYLPHSASSEILISANNGVGFEQNIPISLCVFSDEVKTKGKLSNVKSVNASVSVVGAIYAKEFGFGGAILLNIDAKYIETTNSNIFILKEGKIYTPPLADGCVDGTMRNWVLSQESVIEKSINQIDIEGADEVFISNAISGIIPVEVVSIESTQIYANEFAQNLQEKLINLSLGL